MRKRWSAISIEPGQTAWMCRVGWPGSILVAKADRFQLWQGRGTMTIDFISILTLYKIILIATNDDNINPIHIPYEPLVHQGANCAFFLYLQIAPCCTNGSHIYRW